MGRRHALILAYHRFGEADDDPFQLTVPAATLERQLSAVQRWAEPVCLDDVGRSGPRPRVAVTVDDGYRSVWSVLLPTAEQMGIPVACYVATSALGRGDGMWWDRVAAIVAAAPASPEPVRLRIGSTDIRLPLTGPGWRDRLLQAVHGRMRLQPPADLPPLVAALGAALQVTDTAIPSLPMMTEDEVRQIATSPLVTLGAHTVDHPLLPALEPVDRRLQIEHGRAVLAEMTGRSVEHFAYPYGDPAAFDAETVAMVGQLGFRTAVTTVPGRVGRRTDPLRLPRFTVTASTDVDALLRRWLSW